MRASSMGVLRLLFGLLPLLGQCTAQLEKLALLASSSTPLGLSNGVAVGNSFDQSRLGDSPSSSFLPGFQRQPIDFQNFLSSSSSSISPASSGRFSPAFNAGFGSSFGGGSGGGTMLTNGLDIETFTKNAAIQANQDNAIVAQLANMASTKRAQLARDVGNRTAVNELVSRIRNELVGSPTGLGSSSQTNRLGSLLMLDQQQQQLGALQRQLGIGGGMGNGMGIGGNGLSISQQQRLAAENQLLRQMLLAAQNGQSRGLPPPFNVGGGQSGLLGGGVVSNPFGVSSNQQLGQGGGGGGFNGGSLLGAFPPPNPFPGAAADSSILTRPLAANSMLLDQLPLLAGAKHAASPITNIRPSTLNGDPSNSASDGEDALLRSLNRLQQGPREGFIDNVEDGFGHRVPVQRQGRDSVIPTSDAFAVEAVEGALPLPPPPHIARREESGKHKASHAAAKAKTGGVQSGADSVVTHQDGGSVSAATSPQDKSKS